jgi:hypothetical protein
MYEDPTALYPPMPDSLDLVVDLEGMLAVVAAERLHRVDELRQSHLDAAHREGRTLTEVVMRGLRLELAAAMRVTEYAAARLLALAEALVQRYPAVLSALGRAEISERHAELLADAMDFLDPELREPVLVEALECAKVESTGAFRRKLRRLTEAARATALEERHAHALESRRMCVEQVDDGMAWTHIFGPAVEAHAIFGRVTAIAKTMVGREDDVRTLDQVRADVIADLLIDGTVASHPAEARGIRASVVVTVPALALLDADGGDWDAATVEGVGPIPIARARELCGGDGTWMRVLTHPETGAVLSVARAQYSPPSSLRRLVKWRSDRCLAPGCGMPASRCEIDHTIAWEHGGRTELENLAPLCKGHHTVKHHGGWHVRHVPDSGGVVEWTSPAGRRYLVEPERRVPSFRVAVASTIDESPPF